MKTVLRKTKIYLVTALVVLLGMAALEQVILSHKTDNTLIDLTAEEQSYIDNTVVDWAVEANYPPFSYMLDGEPVGISADYINLISRLTGLRFKPSVVCDLENCINSLKEGEVSLVPSLKPTPERSKFMTFSRPYEYSGTFRVKKKGSIPRTVSIGKGYAVKSYITDVMVGLVIVESNSDDESVRKMLAGEVDSVILDQVSLGNIKQRHDLSEYEFDRLEFEYIYCFAVSPGNTVLLSILDKAISTIGPTEQSRIRAKWN